MYLTIFSINISVLDAVECRTILINLISSLIETVRKIRKITGDFVAVAYFKILLGHKDSRRGSRDLIKRDRTVLTL